MNWRRVGLSVTASLWLLPQFIYAQADTEAKPEETATPTEPEPDPAPSETTPIIESTPAVESTPAKEETATASKGKGLLGDIRIGPSVAAGIPHPVTGGLDIVYADQASLSVTGGRFGVNLSDTDIEIRNWEAAARWFPFQGSFFVGAAYGNQGIVGKRKVDLNVTSNGVALKVPTTLRLEIESNYLTPQIGWYARWDCGFTLGFDFGYQMPSGAKSKLQTSFENVSTASEASVRNSDEYKKNKKDVEDAAETIGKMGIPYITLLRLGWLF